MHRLVVDHVRELCPLDITLSRDGILQDLVGLSATEHVFDVDEFVISHPIDVLVRKALLDTLNQILVTLKLTQIVRITIFIVCKVDWFGRDDTVAIDRVGLPRVLILPSAESSADITIACLACATSCDELTVDVIKLLCFLH